MSRAGYQALSQSVDDEEDVGETAQLMAPTGRGRRRAHKSGSIDLTKLDQAFKRCVVLLSNWDTV